MKVGHDLEDTLFLFALNPTAAMDHHNHRSGTGGLRGGVDVQLVLVVVRGVIDNVGMDFIPEEFGGERGIGLAETEGANK